MGFVEEEHQPLFLPITVSIVVHLLLLLFFIVVPAHLPTSPKETVIEVFPPNIEDNAILTAAPRIADIDEPLVQKRPKKAKFVGLYDSTAEKETVSRNPGKGGGAAGDRSFRNVKTKVRAKKRSNGTSSVDSRDKLFNFDENLFAMREPQSQAKESVANPSKGKVSIGEGGGGDFFPDVTIGANTYLNVLRYPDVSYFVRLKRVFRTTFNPIPALRNYFSLNQVARGSIDVVMGVTVNKTGTLSELFVIRSSGIPDYDREALRTVRASAPFSRPPEKFLENDDVLRMMWTFTVYL